MPHTIVLTHCEECGGLNTTGNRFCGKSCAARFRNWKTPEEALLGPANILVLPNGCWQWLGSLTAKGYGRATYRQWKGKHAHRAVYEHLKGPIQEGLEPDHICHDPNECKLKNKCPHRACVNPDHIALVPHAENASNDRTDVSGREIQTSAFGETKSISAWQRDPRCSFSIANLGKRFARMPAEQAIAGVKRKQKESAPSILTAFGESKTAAKWSLDSRCVVKLPALYKRLESGWPHERAISFKGYTRMPKDGKYCGHGHEMSKENVYQDPNSKRIRCRKCMREGELRRTPRLTAY